MTDFNKLDSRVGVARSKASAALSHIETPDSFVPAVPAAIVAEARAGLDEMNVAVARYDAAKTAKNYTAAQDAVIRIELWSKTVDEIVLDVVNVD